MKLNFDDSLFVLADVIRAIFQHFCYKNDKMWTSWVRVAYFDIFCGVTVERVLDLWALIRSLWLVYSIGSWNLNRVDRFNDEFTFHRPNGAIGLIRRPMFRLSKMPNSVGLWTHTHTHTAAVFLCFIQMRRGVGSFHKKKKSGWIYKLGGKKMKWGTILSRKG